MSMSLCLNVNFFYKTEFNVTLCYTDDPINIVQKEKKFRSLRFVKQKP